MADYDSAWCLAKFRGVTGTTSNTADTDDPTAYGYLASAQVQLVRLLASVAPLSQIGAPALLTSLDSGATYVLPSTPMSHFELYDGNPNGIRIFPIGYGQNLWDGYVLENDTIRFPGGRTRTFSRGLYARYVATPARMSASVAPVLHPADAREAMCYRAASIWAHDSGAIDPTPYDDEYRRMLRGDPAIGGDVGLIGHLQTQAQLQGLPSGMGARGGRWYASSDFLAGPG